MARNEEKQITRLNRLLLQQQREEEEKKNPKRPKLNTLNSVADIQKWLPSLKKDIDFYLKQSQVPCYPARKIQEFTQEIDRLKREYQAFVRKLKQLDPSVEIVPWTERGYSARKRPVDSTVENGDVTSVKFPKPVESKSFDASTDRSSDPGESPTYHRNIHQEFVPIVTPILEKEEIFQNLYGYQDTQTKAPSNFHFALEDKPLQFARVSDQAVLMETCQPENRELEIKRLEEPCSLRFQSCPNVRKSEVSSEGDPGSVEIFKGNKSLQKNSLSKLADMYGGSSSESEDSGDSSEA